METSLGFLKIRAGVSTTSGMAVGSSERRTGSKVSARPTGAWRLLVAVAAYGVVFVLVPVVLLSVLVDGLERDLAMTAYFVALTGIFVTCSWRLDRGRYALYAEMVTVSQQPGSATLMPNPVRLRRFLHRRIPIIAVLCALAVAFPRLHTMVEALVPWIIALAVITVVSWHTSVPGLVATGDGLFTRRHGLIRWSQITAMPVVRSGDARFLQIWVCDRVEIALRAVPARPRVARWVAAFVQRRAAPLTGVYEPFVLLDLDDYQSRLETLAGRGLGELPVL